MSKKAKPEYKPIQESNGDLHLVLIQDYQFRHDIKIVAGSQMVIEEIKGHQLINAGLAELFQSQTDNNQE